jgi:hypothetical protein
MADSDAITRLERRLQREAPKPLTDLSNQMTASLFSLIRTLAQWVRASAEEKPLITLQVCVSGRLCRCTHRAQKCAPLASSG